jgi:hypothetical protein
LSVHLGESATPAFNRANSPEAIRVIRQKQACANAGALSRRCHLLPPGPHSSRLRARRPGHPGEEDSRSRYFRWTRGHDTTMEGRVGHRHLPANHEIEEAPKELASLLGMLDAFRAHLSLLSGTQYSACVTNLVARAAALPNARLGA